VNIQITKNISHVTILFNQNTQREGEVMSLYKINFNSNMTF